MRALTIEKALGGSQYLFSLKNSTTADDIGGITCAITSPTAGATVTQGTPVTVNVTTSVSASGVAFKVNGSTVGSMTGSGTSWTYSWTPSSTGAASLTATATASAGGTGDSPAVNVTVSAASVDWTTYFPGAWAILEPNVGTTDNGTTLTVTDRSGNGKNGTASGTARAAITASLGGCNSLVADGSDDVLSISGLTLPAPGTTPYYVFAVFRYLATAADACLLGNGDAAYGNRVGCLSATPSTGFYHKNANVAGVSVTINPLNWNILEIKRSNNASDTTKIGAVSATGNAGNDAVSNVRVFHSPGAGVPANAELLVLVYTPNLPDWSAVRAAVTAKYGGSVAV